MAVYQLLVRIKDKDQPDARLAAKCLKRGDVIAVKPDATAWWTPRELSNPEWMVIKADITRAMAESLLAPELPPDLTREYTMLQKRAIGLNLDSLSVPQTRDRETYSRTLTTIEATDAVVVKERIPEPDEVIRG